MFTAVAICVIIASLHGSRAPSVTPKTDGVATGRLSPANRGSSQAITNEVTDVENYRELLYFLVWRDVKIRYKQTALGPLGGCSNR